MFRTVNWSKSTFTRTNRSDSSDDRSIDYASERTTKTRTERPFNSGKWLDRDNGSHPSNRCNLFNYRRSLIVLTIINPRLVYRAISFELSVCGFLPAHRIVHDRWTAVQAPFRAKGNVAWATTRDSFPLIKERGEDCRELLTERIAEKAGMENWARLGFPFLEWRKTLSMDDSSLATKRGSRELKIDSTREQV